MPGPFDDLVRWVRENFNLVIYLVAGIGAVLLPLFRRMAEARERAARGEGGPRTLSGEGGPRGLEMKRVPPEEETKSPRGPAQEGGRVEFDWGRWLREMEERASGRGAAAGPEPEEEAEEAPAERVPAHGREESLEAQLEEEEAKPVYQRRPLTRAKPLTEARSLEDEAPLTAARPLTERVEPLTAATPLTELEPLTAESPYEAGREPEAVGSLEPGAVATVDEGIYEVELGGRVGEIEGEAGVSSLAREKPTSPPGQPAAVEIAGIFPGDAQGWGRALVAGEVLGRPLGLRGEREGLPPGLVP